MLEQGRKMGRERGWGWCGEGLRQIGGGNGRDETGHVDEIRRDENTLSLCIFEARFGVALLQHGRERSKIEMEDQMRQACSLDHNITTRIVFCLGIVQNNTRYLFSEVVQIPSIWRDSPLVLRGSSLL
jgi:hypothetical protein